MQTAEVGGHAARYFKIVKPTLVEGFNYKSVDWADLPAPFPASPKSNVGRQGQLRLCSRRLAGPP
jgi:hypothetical protein